MAQFKKKPVVIDAVQFNNLNKDEIEAFIGRELKQEIESETAYIAGIAPPISSLTIPTLEGDMKAMAGDWIIKGVKGEFYPCKPDIFEMTYSPCAVGVMKKLLTTIRAWFVLSKARRKIAKAFFN